MILQGLLKRVAIYLALCMTQNMDIVVGTRLHVAPKISSTIPSFSLMVSVV